MKKQKRNDPCACGSGKKYKKCCGKDNVLAFNPSKYNDELELLEERFINFTVEHFEIEITDAVQYFATDFINMMDEEGISIYTQLITAWTLFNAHVEDDKTLFDLFYAKAKNTIKYPSVKQTFARWSEMHSGVFDIIPDEENVKLIDIATGETFYTSLDTEMNYKQENLAIGSLIPYTDTHEFFMLMIQVPAAIFRQEIVDLIEEETEGDLTIKETFPSFIGGLLQLGGAPGMEWDHIDHEIVASIFREHATEKGYDEMSVQMAVHFWNEFCDLNDPIIRKHEGHAAALDYFMQVELMSFTNVTQAQLAKEYGTSPGTISNHYGRLSEDFELFFLEDDEEEPYFDAPFNMEKEMRDLTRLIEEQDFESDEELNDFMQELMGLDEMPPSDNPRDIAQDILIDASETDGIARKKLINEALSIYPHSPDAYLLLAEDERDIDKRMELLEKAIDVGEKDLGDTFFVENKGHFWGLLETRPFMRAKAMYATYLGIVGYLEEAMDAYKELLALNPTDNQGVRYLLLTIYLELEKYEAANALIEEYDEGTATFIFSEALLHYEQHGITKEGLDLLKEAVASNPFVMDYLLGNKSIPSETSDYVGLGDETEAIAYAQGNAHLWADAEEFLKMI